MSHEIQEVEVDESQEQKREDLELYRPERVVLEEDTTVDIVAEIHDYVLTRRSDGAFALMGKVKNHPRQAEFTTEVQQTSAITLFDETKGIAITKNTGYRLINRAGEPPLKVENSEGSNNEPR